MIMSSYLDWTEKTNIATIVILIVSQRKIVGIIAFHTIREGHARRHIHHIRHICFRLRLSKIT